MMFQAEFAEKQGSVFKKQQDSWTRCGFLLAPFHPRSKAPPSNAQRSRLRLSCTTNPVSAKFHLLNSIIFCSILSL